MFKRTTLSTLIASFCVFSVHANTEDWDNIDYDALEDEMSDEEALYDMYGDEEFVSIATGNKKLIHKAPSVASVITAEDMKKMGATDIDDVLETVPGLHVSRNANSYLPAYVIRGINSTYNPQVLVLINGVPITNTFVGNRSQVWGGMTVDSLSRIEVIRGPGSALYGADAFSGVINLITKNADSDVKGSEAGGRVGGYGTQNLWINHVGEYGDVKAAASFEYFKTDGSDKIIEADAQTAFDTVFGTNASNAPGSVDNNRDNFEFRTDMRYQGLIFQAGWQHREIGSGIGIAEALDPTGVQESNRYNLNLIYNTELTDKLDLQLQGSYLKTSQEITSLLHIYPKGTDIGFGAPFPDGMLAAPEVFEKHTRYSAVLDYTGLKAHDIKIGVGHNINDMYKTKEKKNFGFDGAGNFIIPGSPVVDVTDTPAIFIPEAKRDSNFIFLQDTWAFSNDWELTGGIRYDDYSDFGSTTNPRLALVWATSLNLTTKLLYGQAFRAPAFAETIAVNNPVALGNSNLKPEEIETIELAFDYHPQTGVNLIGSLFHYTWNDLITFVPDVGENVTTNTAQNEGKQKGTGAELEFEWELSKNLELAGNFSIQKSENDITGEEVPLVPTHQFFVMTNWQINDSFTLNYKINAVLGRQRAELDTRKDIDDYNTHDIVVRWKSLDTGLSAAIIGRNIFDTDAREPTPFGAPITNIPNDIPLDGSQWLAELRYNF